MDKNKQLSTNTTMKQKNFEKYKSKRNPDDPIKIRWLKAEPMSKDGYKNWAKHLRPTIKRKVWKYDKIPKMLIPTSTLSNTKNIEKLATSFLYEGEWIMMGWSHGKNKHKVKPIKLCRIHVLETSEGLKANISEKFRLSRYWFWNDK